MNKKIIRNLYKKDVEELRAQCVNLTIQMKEYMSDELEYQTILILKSFALDALFEIQEKITEIDGTYGLLDGANEPQLINAHANLVEYLLGALEGLERYILYTS